MDSPKITYKYYSNPAFCAQSEVVYTQQTPCVSPRIATSPKKVTGRVLPLGAYSPRKNTSEYQNHRVRTDISDNPLRNIHTKDGPLRYVNDDVPPKPGPKPKNTIERREIRRSVRRYEKTNQIKDDLEMYQVGSTNSDNTDSNVEEETTMDVRITKHRYAEISEDWDECSPSKKRIIETDPEEYNVDTPDPPNLTEVPTEIIRTVNGKAHRYAIIPTDEELYEEEIENRPTFHLTSPNMSRKSLEATQKLHELLATPKKPMKKICVGSPLKSSLSSPSLRTQANAQSHKKDQIVSSTPKQKVTPSRSFANLTSPPLPRRNQSISPRAQQRLNYEITPNFYVREKSFDRTLNRSYELDSKDYDDYKTKRNAFIARSTAVIVPRLADTSVYADAKSVHKWKPTPACASLVLAAAMLALCGALTTALSFYIMYTFQREYYLDFGVLSGFTCLTLGLLGLRSRREKLLPNRNYMSGYVVISISSLLSCAALLTLLCMGLHWKGGILREIIGVIFTGLNVLCLFLAVFGAFASFCCGHPPPDNRVADAVGV